MLRWFKRWRRKPKQEPEGRDAEDSVELPLKIPPPIHPPEPPSPTGIYEAVKKDIDQATEEKKQARSTVQKLIDRLPGDEKEKK
jgi:hypothetical protein